MDSKPVSISKNINGTSCGPQCTAAGTHVCGGKIKTNVHEICKGHVDVNCALWIRVENVGGPSPNNIQINNSPISPGIVAYFPPIGVTDPTTGLPYTYEGIRINADGTTNLRVIWATL